MPNTCDSPGHSERGRGTVNSYRWRVHPQEQWRHWSLCEGCAADFSKSVEIECKDKLECQCESIHCEHGDEPCSNTNAAPAKTVAFGTFNFCPACRKGYEAAGYLSEER